MKGRNLPKRTACDFPSQALAASLSLRSTDTISLRQQATEALAESAMRSVQRFCGKFTSSIACGQMEMANASGNFGNTLVGLRAWNITTVMGKVTKSRFFCSILGAQGRKELRSSQELEGHLALSS